MSKSPRAASWKRDRPPFETEQLRLTLREFLTTPFDDPVLGKQRAIGSFKWGAYLFYDYDGEPIYAGQTCERVSQRISRHLTNQRTDAVAMSVLDPFEVFEIEVWPLPQFETVKNKTPRFHPPKRIWTHLSTSSTSKQLPGASSAPYSTRLIRRRRKFTQRFRRRFAGASCRQRFSSFARIPMFASLVVLRSFLGSLKPSPSGK